MEWRTRVVDLPPLRGETLADQIREVSQETDLFARTVRSLAIAAKVARLERAWDQITADAMADHRAAQAAENVVEFRRRGK
jgi:hypothetical protein